MKRIAQSLGVDSISFHFLYSQVEFMLHEENNTSCCSLSNDAKNAYVFFNISKVIKLIVFSSQVILACELFNRDIKNYIFI